MSQKNILKAVTEVREVCTQALVKAGVPKANAYLQADLLLDAEMKGHVSHGLLRLPRLIRRIHNGVADPVAQGKGMWRGEATLFVDGSTGLGPVVAIHAIEQLVAKTETTGVAVGAVQNCNHLGMLAWYAEQVAMQGMVFIGLTISEALVHPWGGRRAMLGTNPIAIGVPAEPTPFVLDLATSEVSMGKIHDYANRKEPIPDGWALDKDGEPTTEAHKALDGALTPFGGAKGYGLGLGFEVLVASLTGCAIGTDVVGTLDDISICNKGDVFIVLRPAPGALSAISGYLAGLRESTPAMADSPVLVPGDRADAARQHSLANGLSIDAGVWKQIQALLH